MYKNLFKIFFFISFLLAASFSLFSATDGDWVSLEGRVIESNADYFILRTNARDIIVEMDDYDQTSEGYNILIGDEVVVYGRLDKDFLEKAKVEADNVYVKGIDTYFFASSEDEEGGPYYSDYNEYFDDLKAGTEINVVGRVTSINGKSFLLGKGDRSVKVDTTDMLYNPLDNVGFKRIRLGDKVRVSGYLDKKVFARHEVDAQSVYIVND